MAALRGRSRRRRGGVPGRARAAGGVRARRAGRGGGGSAGGGGPGCSGPRARLGHRRSGAAGPRARARRRHRGGGGRAPRPGRCRAAAPGPAGGARGSVVLGALHAGARTAARATRLADRYRVGPVAARGGCARGRAGRGTPPDAAGTHRGGASAVPPGARGRHGAGRRGCGEGAHGAAAVPRLPRHRGRGPGRLRPAGALQRRGRSGRLAGEHPLRAGLRRRGGALPARRACPAPARRPLATGPDRGVDRRLAGGPGGHLVGARAVLAGDVQRAHDQPHDAQHARPGAADHGRAGHPGPACAASGRAHPAGRAPRSG